MYWRCIFSSFQAFAFRSGCYSRCSSCLLCNANRRKYWQNVPGNLKRVDRTECEVILHSPKCDCSLSSSCVCLNIIKFWHPNLRFPRKQKCKYVFCISERVLGVRRWGSGHKSKYRHCHVDIRESCFSGGGWMLEQMAWRVCGVSFRGDVQNLTGHNPEPPALFDSALSERVGLG